MIVIKPAINSNPSERLSKYLRRRLDELAGPVTHQEIAQALGYPRAGIISMFKNGEAKVPLDKIPALAEVLRVDVAFLMRLGLYQFWADKIDALDRTFADILSDHERAVIDLLRQVIGDRDIGLSDNALEDIRSIIEKDVEHHLIE